MKTAVMATKIPEFRVTKNTYNRDFFPGGNSRGSITLSGAPREYTTALRKFPSSFTTYHPLNLPKNDTLRANIIISFDHKFNQQQLLGWVVKKIRVSY